MAEIQVAKVSPRPLSWRYPHLVAPTRPPGYCNLVFSFQETAQQELNEQKHCYEKRLTQLQNSLVGWNMRFFFKRNLTINMSWPCVRFSFIQSEVGAEKTEIEKSHQSAEDKINQLQAHKMVRY